jgi:superfamily II DNA helicase RecQ
LSVLAADSFPANTHPTLAQINYAESTTECRRMLLMHHFGEPNFTPAKCGGTCDVCASGAPDSVEPQDLTAQAQQLVRLLQLMGEGQYSSTYLLEVWRDKVSARHFHQVGTSRGLMIM